ncbi:SEC-C metal-binding domain-containing protein [Actinacidiphila glaucinigra]|uniref:SEC-C metal-binding domain-containing protein n=1 Tax=Actinacidiphila glaucinigra TaxID=235986 RepID=UPI0035E09312
MISRRFLTDAELDKTIDHLARTTNLNVATLDQFDAASRDMAGMTLAMATAAADRGDRSFLGALPEDLATRKQVLGPWLKMLIAAHSAGVTHLCEHTQQIRPLLLSCDPPSMVCMTPACIAKVDEHAKATGFHWDHQCDGCGQPTEVVFPYLTTFGPLTISGHLCKPCSTERTETAAAAAAFQVVGRKSDCPCGSGRRFKRCHGRAA